MCDSRCRCRSGFACICSANRRRSAAAIPQTLLRPCRSLLLLLHPVALKRAEHRSCAGPKRRPFLSAASLGAVPRVARSTGHRCSFTAPHRTGSRRRQRFWFLLPRQKELAPQARKLCTCLLHASYSCCSGGCPTARHHSKVQTPKSRPPPVPLLGKNWMRA
ncbi:hypothetical protein EIQ06_17230 [Xanthomonas campestris pv. campestris]|uniref:Uncharacterized protein n=3 Tax=Xanthomonas campestris pv. campestris TaxID=340 RepID=Q8PBY2_XANCP|nr:hypothetical protein XCC0983 [Xanthomonas campestris pv. campestris str. ATCC 33913]AAY50304.1 conserved hypothetical protein [Xanthomonas campestris pv. campestris str. 8004]AKS17179.1 hypothetical protein AEA00_15495 [Xanthomonas campestris pv. campestris]AKS21201.1 hypothetical protein AEA01_15580 [Xanthomonas campestris pv. campestris]ALE67870.1 hypothetical protein AAW18_04900 [Xanthomonas campestris pv. campestris]